MILKKCALTLDRLSSKIRMAFDVSLCAKKRAFRRALIVLFALPDKAEQVRDVHVLGDVLAVIAEPDEHAVHAVVGTEAVQRVVTRPIALHRVDQLGEVGLVAIDRVPSLARGGVGDMYRVVVAFVVHAKQVVLVLFDEFERALDDLVVVLFGEIVHIPAAEYAIHALVFYADDAGLFTRADERVKDAVDSDDGLFVAQNAVRFGLSARVHRRKADGRLGREDGDEAVAYRRNAEAVLQLVGILVHHPIADGVGVVDEHAVGGKVAVSFGQFVQERFARRRGVRRGSDAGFFAQRRAQPGQRVGEKVAVVTHIIPRSSALSN